MCILLNGANLSLISFIVQTCFYCNYLEREVMMSVVWPNEHSQLINDRVGLLDWSHDLLVERFQFLIDASRRAMMQLYTKDELDYLLKLANNVVFYYQNVVPVPSETVSPAPIVVQAIVLDFLAYFRTPLVDRFHQALMLMMVEDLEIVRFLPNKMVVRLTR